MASYRLKRTEVHLLADTIPNILRCVVVHRTLKYALVGKNNPNVYIIATEPTFADVARTEITRWNSTLGRAILAGP